jgi:hypothetical protein
VAMKPGISGLDHVQVATTPGGEGGFTTG